MAKRHRTPVRYDHDLTLSDEQVDALSDAVERGLWNDSKNTERLLRALLNMAIKARSGPDN